MQNRELKFRAWVPEIKTMLIGVDVYANGSIGISTDKISDDFYKIYHINWDGDFIRENGTYRRIMNIFTGDNYIWFEDGFNLMQFTGHKTADGKDIYQSHIFRIEENAADLEEEDRIYYVIVCWIQEWSMFATLLIDEYHKYLSEGVKALDEPMFWTYDLRSTGDKGIYLCGNIHEHSHLLNQ